MTARQKARKAPRNKSEQRHWDWLTKNKIKFGYEDTKLPYSIHATYITDFTLPSGIYVESKGYFRVEDKRKMKSVKKDHPEKDIRIVFDEAKTPSAKKALDANIRWCVKLGFPYAVGMIPKEWFK